MKQITSILLLIFISLSPLAKAIECSTLVKNNTIDLELNKAEAFDNCFSIGNIPQNTPVQFVAYSENNVLNKISLFDLNAGGTSSYIAEYSSDSMASNAFNSNTTNKNLAFKVTPTSHRTTDKDVSVTFLMVNGTAQVLIEIYDITSSSPPPPVIDDGCRGSGNRESSC